MIPFVELRSKCSDSDLMTMIKSRHLQSPCEILSWCKYMKDNVDVFNNELKQFVQTQVEVKKQVINDNKEA